MRKAKTVSLVLISLWLGCFARPGTLLAQTSQLDLTAFDANQRPRLRVAGSAGTNYTLEQSANLSDWYSVYTGVATNGVLEYLDAPVSRSAAFYRARVATPPLQVSPRVDTNRVGIGLVTSSGGYCEVTALNGTRFRLTVPSNAVPESVAITMTVITNLAGVPGGGLFPAAVQMEPDGLRFLGAAALEIEFPTNIPVNQIASYAFSKTGTDFYLTPDQVQTNRVMIPVTHFSAAGTTRVKKEELAGLITLSIANALNQLNQTVASKIDLARQDGNATVETMQNAFVGEARKFLQDNILPYLQEATHNCALYRQIMPQIYGLDRTAQLLGVTSIPELATAEAIACAGVVNCEEEIIQQCQQGGGNTGLLAQLIDAERSRQLLGETSCPPPADFFTGMTNCMPLWMGKLTYAASGATNDTSDPKCVQTWTSGVSFSGIVTNAEETDLGMFKIVTLHLSGDADGQRAYESTCNDQGSCAPDPGSWSEYQHTLNKWVKAGKETAMVTWYSYPDGTAQGFSIAFGNESPCTLNLANQTRDIACDGTRTSSDQISSMVSTLDAYTYYGASGAGITATSASGTASQIILESTGLSSTATWTWDFHRK